MSSMRIGTAEASLGSKGFGFIKIGELADGSPVNVPVIILKGAKPGPCLWVQAMIHGDEIHGCFAIWKTISKLNPNNMNGTLIAIPALNILGVRSYRRTAEDPSLYFHNVDLNLAFPGSSEGDFMEQAGNILLEQIRANANYMIDLHSHGMFGLIWPGWSLCYDDGSEYSQEAIKLAKYFGLKYIVASDFKSSEAEGYVLAHCLRMPFTVATSLGIPSIIVEAGGGIEPTDEIVDSVSEGIFNVLKYLRVVKGQVQMKDSYTIFKRIVDVKAKRGGVFITKKKTGMSVSKGEILGTMMNLFGEKIEDIVSPLNGVVLAHQLYPFVSTGVLLFHMGEKGE